MPGGIDTHVHINWHFDENGKAHDPETDAESEHSLGYGLENAYATFKVALQRFRVSVLVRLAAQKAY